MQLKIGLEAEKEAKAYSIERFEELFQLTYLRQLQFADWETEQWLLKKCARAHKKGKIGQLALWLGRYHARDLASAQIPDVAIQWLHEKIGYGLITNQPMKKWQFIGEYTGLLRRRNLFFPNINDYCFMYPREWWGTRAYTIDSQDCGNYTRFINHCDTEPNCESVSVYHNGVFHIVFRTIREVKAGEQLTDDYGDVYWKRRKKLEEPEKIEDLVPPEAIPYRNGP